MKEKQFRNLNVGDLVMFTEAFPDMPHGWNDEMDALVGQPLIVMSKGDSTVRIASQDSVLANKDDFSLINTYTSRYEFVELFYEVTADETPWQTERYRYTCLRVFNASNVEGIYDREKYNDFINCFAEHLSDKWLVINEEVFSKLKAYYPKVICYCVANSILKREGLK